MKKKIIFIIISFILIILIGFMFVKFWQYTKYKSNINDISSINIESHTLKGMSFYKKGSINCIIFFNSNCDSCLDEIEDIVDNIDDFKDVNFYLVSNQNENELVKYNEDSEFLGIENFTILVDKKDVFNHFFSFPKLPSTFIYNINKQLIDYEHNYTEIEKIKLMIKLL